MRRLVLAMVLITAACNAAQRPSIVREHSSPRHIVVFGDSLALGSGASDPADAFAFRLFLRIANGSPRVEISNHAAGGARVADVIDGQLAFARHEPATDIWIAVGSNDVTHGTSAAAFRREESRLLHALRRQWYRARIVVFGIPDVARSPLFTGSVRREYRRRAAEMNAAARDAARSAGGRFVDLYAFSDRVLDVERDLSSDEFHPNDRGHEAIANFAYATVR